MTTVRCQKPTAYLCDCNLTPIAENCRVKAYVQHTEEVSPMKCKKCQSESPGGHKFCHACGQVLSADLNKPADLSKGSWQREIKLPWPKVGLGFSGLALLVVCFFHIVWVNGVPTPVKRLSPGLSEPTSSLEAISGMPWISAVSQYPLTVQALQQAGYLESNAARQERIENQLQSNLQSQMQQIREQLGY